MPRCFGSGPLQPSDNRARLARSNPQHRTELPIRVPVLTKAAARTSASRFENAAGYGDPVREPRVGDLGRQAWVDFAVYYSTPLRSSSSSKKGLGLPRQYVRYACVAACSYATLATSWGL